MLLARRFALCLIVAAGLIFSGCLVLFPVDKERGLPPDFVPPDIVRIDPVWNAPGFGFQELRSEARSDLIAMLRDARAEGHEILVRSSYRSYELQEVVFEDCVQRLGREQALLECAPPGHSEHQLGTTVDLTSPGVDYDLIGFFGQTAEGRWLQRNAHRYGFALSYPEGAIGVTGYIYEPWHFRWIGREEAAQWKASGLTLIEYLEQR